MLTKLEKKLRRRFGVSSSGNLAKTTSPDQPPLQAVPVPPRPHHTRQLPQRGAGGGGRGAAGLHLPLLQLHGADRGGEPWLEESWSRDPILICDWPR